MITKKKKQQNQHQLAQTALKIFIEHTKIMYVTHSAPAQNRKPDYLAVIVQS